MAKGETNPKVDGYLRNASTWHDEMAALRKIILSFGVTEELKWGKPCYMFDKSNVLFIIALKENCALMFCKGALLKDAKGVLGRPGEHTQAGRWIKFTSVSEIKKMEATVKAYIREVIEAEKAGSKVEYRKNTDLVYPEEFQKILASDRAVKAAFEALTPGRQRAYHIFFTGAKQSRTREARVEKCLPMILEGRGLNDR